MLKEAYITKQFYSEQPFPAGPYCLSMHISDSSFMYAISTSNFQTIVELLHVQFGNAANTAAQLKEQVAFLVQNYFLQRKKFEKVHIAFLNHDFTLVPEAFATESNLRPLLNFSTGNTALRSPATHFIKGIKFLHTVHPELSDYLEKTFVNASVRHAGAINIGLLFSQHSLLESQVFMNVGDGCVELAIKNKTELQFYNVFNFQSNEDILYYLLFTMEQFGLNPLLVKLSLAGQVPVTDELVKSLKKYIKYVSFCVNDPSIVLNGELSQLPQQYYFTLFNQHLCGL
ncbi:MAG: DUF3822 family protein [Bacteroidota bacterium]